MQTASTHGGDLSQDSGPGTSHRSGVAEKVSKLPDDLASRRTRQMFNTLSASSVGLELGVAVIITLLGGIWLDNQLGTTPWLMLLCLVIGLIAGFRNVLRAVERADRAAAGEESRRG